MPEGPELITNRLVLRRWRDSDLPSFAAINADPAVMEYFPELLTEGQTAKFIERIEAHFDKHGFGLWALELGLTGELVGFTGLSIPRFDAPFMPAVEVGWRLASQHWGKGYATEAARTAMDYGFNTIDLSDIISFATASNSRSIRVMRRLGMTNDPADDFDHPRLPEDSPIRRHVLYRMSASRWARLSHR